MKRQCGAGVLSRPALPLRTVSQVRSTNDKVRSAAAVYPDATAVVSPAIALRASRVAALTHHLNAATRVGCTVVPFSVVRRAGYGYAWASRTIAGATRTGGAVTRSDHKVRTAAVIDPDAAAIVSPAIALRASRIAALAHHLDATARVHRAVVPSAVVRRAFDGLRAS